VGEAKVLIGIGVATVLLLVGGVFLFSHKQATQPVQADTQLLIRSDSNQIATSSAKVTLVEFGDFQCPACGAAHPLVKQLLADHDGKMTFVWRNFPLSVHKNAQIAAEAAEAAGGQGKYWEMHNLLFDRQADWADSSQPVDMFVEYAKSLELDPTKFKQAVEGHKFLAKIQQDLSDGARLNVNVTPTFFLDGQKIDGWTDEIKTKINAQTK